MRRVWVLLLLMAALTGCATTNVRAIRAYAHEDANLVVALDRTEDISECLTHLDTLMRQTPYSPGDKWVGRMALTNYLMHSIVLTTIFYGYGFGLYGRIPRLWQMAFVAGLISLQLVISPWWLSKYRFGPAEWAWRSLTYRQLQPFRV